MREPSGAIQILRNAHTSAIDVTLDEMINPVTETRVFIGVTDQLTILFRNHLSSALVDDILAAMD